jgi:Heterokaryon incompatibility protein (HET)
MPKPAPTIEVVLINTLCLPIPRMISRHFPNFMRGIHFVPIHEESKPHFPNFARTLRHFRCSCQKHPKTSPPENGLILRSYSRPQAFNMAPVFEQIINLGLNHKETQPVITREAEQQRGDDTLDQDPAIPQMVDDLLESKAPGALTEEEGGKLKAKDPDRRVEPDGERYDKPSMTDEECEGFAVWIKMDHGGTPEEPRHVQYTEEYNKLSEKFDEYVHHNYQKSWGVFEQKEGKDEEWFIANPLVLEETNPGYLCDMCRHIDFRALFTQRGIPANNLPGPTRITLHGFDRLLKRQNCSFCRLVARKARAEGALDFEDDHAMKAVKMTIRVLDEGPDIALRLEIELEDIKRLPRPVKMIIQQVSEEDSAPFHGILVDREKISTAALQKWRNLCEDDHPEIQDRCINQKQPGLRLIDVNENRIVRVEGPCRYVCLSYVWGKINQPQYTSDTKEAFSLPHGLDSELIRLPRTIVDAILVTKQLGIDYIWIDALCIEQDCEVDKAAVIADMGAIYSNSILTIVASTNSDPSAGLPGVSTTPRTQVQIHEVVQGLHLAVAFHDHRQPLHDIENSVWNSRAWTYQERQLSQRMLFFTNSQMCFLCPHAIVFEDTWPVTDPDFNPAPMLDSSSFYNMPMEIWMRLWQDPTQNFQNKAFETEGGLTIMIGQEDYEVGSDLSAPIYQCRQIHDSDTSAIPKISGQNIWNVYRKAVNSFTCRDITSQADTVNAFAGMTELIRQGANTKFWYGIPAFAFDQALLWYPKEQLQRRKDLGGSELFPSWSWAGWKGACHYRGRGWYNGLYRAPVSAVHWLQKMDPDKFLARYGDGVISGGPEGMTMEQLREDILNGKWKPLEFINSNELYRFDWEERNWKTLYEEERNQHSYSHNEYPGILFNYPIPLPNQQLHSLSDTAGALHFQAYSNKVRFCDMNNTPHVKESSVENYLQLGLHDENRSATHRPPWQRIIYHQGYRAGFLCLNISFDDLDLSKHEELILVAVSRDEIPRTAPPREGWPTYRVLSPVDLSYHISHKEQWHPDKLAARIKPPNEQVDPDIKPKSETGDAKWDEGRFVNPVIHGLYNVLLLRKKRGKETEKPWGQLVDGWERIGVGKMHFHVFHHAGPEMKIFLLR